MSLSKSQRGVLWRQRMNGYMMRLASYIPGLEKMSKAEILSQAVEHMDKLHRENIDLRRRLGQVNKTQPALGKIVKKSRDRDAIVVRPVFGPGSVQSKKDMDEEEVEESEWMDSSDGLAFIAPVKMSWEETYPNEPEDIVYL